ncbi:hypothetical protein LF1_20160 [Rubripirellula obstinata]|uniref:Uncharacterized protein n=1 Tax=Rubripirellula obstinata TaxID=406547 RepID=A0A5B1CH12_9BACT|nr:hypothetical protein LF1_20160 [Rubripirellula obstinata]
MKRLTSLGRMSFRQTNQVEKVAPNARKTLAEIRRLLNPIAVDQDEIALAVTTKAQIAKVPDVVEEDDVVLVNGSVKKIWIAATAPSKIVHPNQAPLMTLTQNRAAIPSEANQSGIATLKNLPATKIPVDHVPDEDAAGAVVAAIQPTAILHAAILHEKIHLAANNAPSAAVPAEVEVPKVAQTIVPAAKAGVRIDRVRIGLDRKSPKTTLMIQTLVVSAAAC